VPGDSEHELVVADLPPDSPVEVWKSFASALPRESGSLRVIPGRQPREVAAHVWQWLSTRTGRPVLAPHGMTHHIGGSLFVHSSDGSGWTRFRHGETAEWAGKRFPRPVWDVALAGRLWAAGSRGVVEPLPAGIWLRPDLHDAVLAPERVRLSTMPCLPDTPTIVLGALPGNLKPALPGRICRAGAGRR
jgi:hypothetical protein